MRTPAATAALICLLPLSSAAAQAGGITEVRATYSARAELPGGGSQDLGTRQVTVTGTTVDGAPAWLVVNAMKIEGESAVDSVLMGAADLRPISRRAVFGQAKLTIDVQGSVLAGSLKSPGGTGDISIPMAERAFLNYYALHTAARTWPLALGWRGTARVLELNGRSELTPVELVVEGDERVRVAAGEFDCWRVHVTGSGGIDERWWVSKAGGRVVRTREPIGGQGAILQLDLVAMDPAP